MILSVTNVSRFPFTLNLARGEDYGNQFLPTRIPFDQVETDPQGETVGVRQRVLSQPASITWLPGETKDELPGALKKLEDFRKAEAAGILRVI